MRLLLLIFFFSRNGQQTKDEAHPSTEILRGLNKNSCVFLWRSGLLLRPTCRVDFHPHGGQSPPAVTLYLRNGPKVHSSNKAFSNWFDSFRMKENGNRKKKRESEDQVRTAPPSRTQVQGCRVQEEKFKIHFCAISSEIALLSPPGGGGDFPLARRPGAGGLEGRAPQ